MPREQTSLSGARRFALSWFRFPGLNGFPSAVQYAVYKTVRIIGSEFLGYADGFINDD